LPALLLLADVTEPLLKLLGAGVLLLLAMCSSCGIGKADAVATLRFG
jgi:hypothetical protein